MLFDKTYEITNKIEILKPKQKLYILIESRKLFVAL